LHVLDALEIPFTMELAALADDHFGLVTAEKHDLGPLVHLYQVDH